MGIVIRLFLNGNGLSTDIPELSNKSSPAIEVMWLIGHHVWLCGNTPCESLPEGGYLSEARLVRAC